MAETAARAESTSDDRRDAESSRLKTNRPRDVLLAVATFGMLAAGAAWVLRAPRLTLAQVQALIHKKDFDNASIRLLRYLDERPEDAEGYRLLSSLLDRDPPALDPSRVLEGLARLSPRDAAARSLLALDRGKASYRLERYDAAEAAWLEALRLDPTVPEAVWMLLGLYYFQGRDRDARKLALAQYRVEPDPRDRVLLLLQSIRADAEPPDPASIKEALRRVERENPKDRRSMISLGLALVNDSQTDEGLAILQKQANERPDDIDAIEAFLTGLNVAGDVEGMAYFLKSLRPETADSDRLAWFQGRVAESRRDWKTAAIAFERASRSDLSDSKARREVLHRLQQALRLAGRAGEADAVIERFKRLEAAEADNRRLYDEAEQAKATLGVSPHFTLYGSIARALVDIARFDEARLWFQLALRDHPDDADSKQRLDRLETQAKRK